MLRLDFLVLDHVVCLLDRADVCHAVLIRLRTHVVEPFILHGLLDVPEALALFVKILRLVDDLEAGLLHADKVLAAEFSVVTDLPDPEPARLHHLEPAHDRRVVVRRRVAHIEPAVVAPAEQRDVVLLGLLCSGHDREPAVRDHDLDALILPVQARRRQVVELRQVRAAVPVNTKPSEVVQLFLRRPHRVDAQRLARCLVRSPELVDIEVCRHGRREHVQRFRQEVFSLLRIVLGLHRLGHDVVWPDRDAVIRVGLLLLDRVGEIHVTALVDVRRADEDEILIIRHRAAQYLPAVLHALGAEARAVVTGGRDDHGQLVCVRFASLAQHVVLRRRFVCVHLIGDDVRRVEGVLFVRISRQRVQRDRPAHDVAVADRVLNRVGEDSPAVSLRRLAPIV